MEAYINAGERLGGGDAQAADAAMAVLADVRGTVAVAETAGPAQRPAVVHYPVAFGQATLLAFDLDREPLASWRDRGKLLRKLLEGESAQAEQVERDAGRGRASHIGYEDLIGQLRSALDEFPGVRLVAFSWVAALIVLYAALIGPADYFLLRRWRGRMERTWLTFPAVVLLFCGLAWAGTTWSKPNRLLLNQLDIVDVDMQSGLVRGSTWSHVYSPEMRATICRSNRNLHWAARRAAKLLLTWQGLPGSGLGGMSSAAGALFPAPYRLAAAKRDDSLHVEPRQMPIPIRSTKGLSGRWWTQGGLPPQAPLTATVDGVLTGEIVNPLTIAVCECTLAYNHWSYRLPLELAPGGARAAQRPFARRQSDVATDAKIRRRRLQRVRRPLGRSEPQRAADRRNDDVARRRRRPQLHRFAAPLPGRDRPVRPPPHRPRGARRPHRRTGRRRNAERPSRSR